MYWSFFFLLVQQLAFVQQENSDFCLAEQLKAQSKSHKGGMVYVCASVCAFELVWLFNNLFFNILFSKPFCSKDKTRLYVCPSCDSQRSRSQWSRHYWPLGDKYLIYWSRLIFHFVDTQTWMDILKHALYLLVQCFVN